LLLEGLWRTVLLSIAAIVLGFALGVFGALGRGAQSVMIRGVIACYVEIIRNTPLLIQLFVAFFVLPSIGIRLSATAAALLTMVLNNGAYVTEIVRSGIESVHPSQIEAGLSLGLPRWRVFTDIVFLPAIEQVFPSLVSQSVLLTLSSSVISAIGADDLTSMGNLIQSQNFRAFEVYIVIAVIYLVLAMVFRLLFWIFSLRLFPRRRHVLQEVWS
jgi:polar amino acid transport system permease protein